MNKFFNDLKHPLIKNITILSDSKSEYVSDLIYNKILKFKSNIVNTFNSDCEDTNQPSDEKILNDNFLFKLHFILDMDGMILCKSKILFRSDVVITILNEKLTIIKHRTSEHVDEYQQFDVSRIILAHKILNIRKNIYN